MVDQRLMKPKPIVRNTTADWYLILLEEQWCPIEHLEIQIGEAFYQRVITQLADQNITWQFLGQGEDQDRQTHKTYPYLTLHLTFPPDTKKVPGLSTSHTYPYVARLANGREYYFMDQYAIPTGEKRTIICLSEEKLSG